MEEQEHEHCATSTSPNLQLSDLDFEREVSQIIDQLTGLLAELDRLGLSVSAAHLSLAIASLPAR